MLVLDDRLVAAKAQRPGASGYLDGNGRQKDS
jgi:hypothetical protein